MRKTVMKLIGFVLGTIALFTSTNVFAQKVAVIDSRKILESMPEYKEVQKKLDSIAAVWRKEIDSLYRIIDQKWRQYRDERHLLTDQMRKQKEQEIIELEKIVRGKQREYFGPDGQFAKKQRELMEPINEKVYNAVRTVARRLRYGIVLDKATGPTVYFVESKYDITDEVIQELEKSRSSK